MSKYDRLSSYLSDQNVSTCKMTFREVENVLGFSLPRSAHNYPAWWANNLEDGRHSKAWLSIGWETAALDLAGKKVTFRRTGSPRPTNPQQSHHMTEPRCTTHEVTRPSNDLPFADTGPVRLVVDMKWYRIGVLALDANGNLVFPPAPSAAGLYRFRLTDGDSASHYTGETTALRRCFQHYRTPRPFQATHICVRVLLKQHLVSGGSAEVDIVVEGANLTINDAKVDTDLSDKAARRVLKNAALLADGATDIDALKSCAPGRLWADLARVLGRLKTDTTKPR